MEEIIKELREMPERFEAHNKFGPLLILDVRNLADRIEAAHKREADSIHRAMVLIAGIEMENPEDPPKLWTALEDAWDALCDALGTDGDGSADVAEAKAIGRHFVVKSSGNAAKMREALKYLRDASREFHHLILNSKHNEICDKYKYPAVAKISDAIANAGAVLAEPPRNCDIGTAEEQEVRFKNYCWNHSSRDKNMECQCPIDTEGRAGCKLEWAQMPYEKGDAQ